MSVSFKMLRLPLSLVRTGYSRSAFYSKIDQGLMTRPVRIGARAVAWPESEIEAILAARVSGVSENEIKALVERLHRARGGVA